MSLPYEQISAQKRIWNCFVEGIFPRKQWPKHFMSSGELQLLFDQLEDYTYAYLNAYKEFPSEENPNGILWKDYALELEKSK